MLRASQRYGELIMWKKIALAFGALVVIFLVVVALQPSDFRIERSISVSAPPSAPFARVIDFRKWNAWSPWDKLDPNMKKDFSGPETGVGSKYAWAGNDQAGEGRMTIVSVDPDRKIQIKLEFLKPFEATNDTVFSFAPDGAGTKINWAMSGKNNFVGKAFALCMNMDEMVGADFDKGLQKLKELSEKAAP